MNPFDRDRLAEVIHTVKSNKRRSGATAFGVAWGIFMLVILVSISAGFKNGTAWMLQGVSTNSGFVYVSRTTLPYRGFPTGRYWHMNTMDLDIIRKQIPEIKYLVPLSQFWPSGNNVFFTDKRGSYAVLGIPPDYFRMFSLRTLCGRLLNSEDEARKRKTCVIGKRIAEQLFGTTDPLEKLIKVNGIYYRIVGVVEPFSNNMNFGSNAGETVFVPYNLFRQLNNEAESVYQFGLTARDGASIESVLARIERIIKPRHDISPDDKHGVDTFNVSQMFKVFTYLFLGLDLLIWIVGIGTLLTGIVGVSNILLVTVRERTREIGVRRALGAKPRDVILQLLSESLLLTSIAGLIGLLAGVAIMGGVSAMFSSPPDGAPFYRPLIPFSTAVISLLIIITGGVLGGLLPAVRALQIKAIDAIRDE